jgi:hypothetical protein
MATLVSRSSPHLVKAITLIRATEPYLIPRSHMCLYLPEPPINRGIEDDHPCA